MVRVARRFARVGAAADLPNAAAFDAYIGPSGEIVVDPARKIIALHDGATAGGVQYTPSVSSNTYSPGALFGLTLSNNIADAVNDINISPGACRDIGDTGNIIIPTALTKRLDAAWAAGNNGGGLDTGSKAASTWYHVWAIRRSDTGVSDILISTSATNPVMPTNFNQKRRIGTVGTDGSLALLPFTQIGGWFYHQRPFVDLTNATGYSSPNLVTLTVPTGIKVRADMTVVPQASTGGNISFVSICDPDTGTAEVYDVVANAYTPVNASQVQVFTNTAGKVSVGTSSNDCQISIYTRGWYDGRDTYV
ncbi:hypothetical protein J5277_09395 [Rhizobium sp. 16-449-1b]|uniref:hypothetical protein n=1 Tax=Rhizobium sp. 16-449-1b TaxID=2819989 RepID=UPI001ADC2F04|nr:hypothetical protein [Rhizobium sp. 16-449-1b]MBO9194318.1 hypothetical protein [Rhizobium sp. 16-449-1b]